MIDADLVRVDLNLLVALQALLSERSVSRAALAMGVTQPAMSNTLRRLRKVFDDDLLVRRQGVYVPTARARSLTDPLDTALALLNRHVLWPGSFDPTTSDREFTISATNAAAALFVPALAARMQREHRLLRLRHVRLEGDVDDLLADPEIDVVLVPDGVATTHPRERLLDEEWSLVVAPSHPAPSTPVTLQELSRYSFGVFDFRGQRTASDLALSAMLPEHAVVTRTDDFLLLVLLAAESELIVMVQEPIARRFTNCGVVRVLETPVVLPRLRIDMVWPPGSRADQGRAWLRTELLSIARNQLDSGGAEV